MVDWKKLFVVERFAYLAVINIPVSLLLLTAIVIIVSKPTQYICYYEQTAPIRRVVNNTCEKYWQYQY